MSILWIILSVSWINLTNGQTSDTYNFGVGNEMTSGVTCGSVDDCIIDCFGLSSCANGYVDASSAKNLILDFRGPSACNKLVLGVGPTVTANISCVWAGSLVCNDASFTVVTTPNVNLVCDTQNSASSYQGGCYLVTLTATQATNVNIDCVSDYDCRSADFKLGSVSGQAVITSNGYQSLYSTDIDTGSANSFSLNCNARSACYLIDLILNYKAEYSTSIYCIPLSNSCSNMKVTIAKSTDIVENFMELLCSRKEISLSCDFDFHCNDISAYFNDDSQYFCNDFDCCPWTLLSGMRQSTTIEPALPVGVTPTISNTTGEYYIFEDAEDDRIISCSNSNCMNVSIYIFFFFSNAISHIIDELYNIYIVIHSMLC